MASIVEETPQLRVATEPTPQSPVTTTSTSPTTRPREDWLSLASIVILGGISGAAYYTGFVRPYLLQDYYAKPLLDLAKINGHTAPAANDWALTWIVLFACYYLAFRLCPPAANASRLFRRVALFLICGWAAFFCINLIFMYPVGAADLFDQIFRARLLSHYNLNPFTTLPNNIAGDPFQPYVAWKGDPSPYGPVWEALAGITSWLGGNSLWQNLVLFKLLVLIAYGVSVALTYGILRVIRPDWALRGTLFFAWNPLVVFEVGGNGHNDALVAMFLLLAIYLFVLARRSAMLVALMAGALTKFVPILLMPVAAAAIWRDRVPSRSELEEVDDEPTVLPRRVTNFDALTTLSIGVVLAAGLAFVMYAPFWTGPDSIGALGRRQLFTASIPKVVLDAIVREAGLTTSSQINSAQTLVRNAALLLIGAIAIVLAGRIFLMGNARTPQERSRLVAHTLGAFYEIVFFYLAFATLWFQPWYLIWLVALTAPVALYTNANRTVLFCIGGVANYFIWDFVWLWNRTAIGTVQIESAIAIYTLPLFYTLYVWLRPSWEHASLGQPQALTPDPL
jgi:hypothetical protein